MISNTKRRRKQSPPANAGKETANGRDGRDST